MLALTTPTADHGVPSPIRTVLHPPARRRSLVRCDEFGPVTGRRHLFSAGSCPSALAELGRASRAWTPPEHLL